MALDTQNRRRIAQGTVLPVADGTIAAEDRGGVIGYLYFAPAVIPYSPSFEETPESEYEQLSKWRVDSWEVGTSVRLSLRDLKTRIEALVAEDVFDNDTYPNASSATRGRIIPVIYGTARGATAFLVDSTTSQFKIASHAIESLTVYANGATISPTTTDLANAEFTWTAYAGETMTVDVTAGLTNPADIAEDLLTTYGGELSADLFQPGSGTAREGQGFGEFGSRTYWLLGHDRDGNEVHAPALSFYIDGETPVLELIGEIQKFAFCNLYTGTDGLFTLRPWEPIRGQDIGADATFAEHEIENAERVDETADTVTRAVVRYRKDHDSGDSQVIIDENEEGRLLRGLPSHKTEEVDSPFDLKRDAEQWGSRYTFMRSRPVETWAMEVPAKAWFLRPGDGVSLTYPHRELDGIFELLSVSFTPGEGMVDLLVGNWRGFGDTVGFPSVDNPTFPDDLGGGSAETWSAGWTDAQKKWARENIMYLTDDNDLGEPTDAQAFRPGSIT